MSSSGSRLDELFMTECLLLAQKGAGFVSPNPMVGAVVVRGGKVISRGYHKKFGGPHAEVNALRSSGGSVRGATLYVNLEPCNFYGKTPPCTDLIISSRVRRVVVGTKDPNPVVAGEGIQALRRAGIDVDVGVLDAECRKLNEFFFKFITSGLPYVTLKLAQTLDGKIADKHGNSKWISNASSRTLTHYLRSRYDAVLVGANTVIVDNPRLTVRHVEGRDPMRIVVSKRLSISPGARVFSQRRAARRVVFTGANAVRRQRRKIMQLKRKNVEVIELSSDGNEDLSLNRVLRILGERGISSLLVEGGATTFSMFLNQNCVDKIMFFVAPRILGNGLGTFRGVRSCVLGREVQLRDISTWNLGSDIVVEGYVKGS